jgi:hypothetical protein
MKKVLRRRPSAAMIVAVLALIAALAGTAIAGGGFVKKKKFNKRINALSRTLATTVKGPVTYASVTASIPVTPVNGAGTNITAPCPAGAAVTGGGIKLSSDAVEAVNDSHPSTFGWSGTVFNFGTVAHTATVTAICVASSTAGGRPTP